MPTLNAIAANLRRRALAHAKAQRTLARGLTLTLLYNYRQHTWMLSLTRHLTKPSDKEEGICRIAFDVPESANRHQLYNASGYNIVRFSWIDVPLQAPLLDAPEKPHEYQG